MMLKWPEHCWNGASLISATSLRNFFFAFQLQCLSSTGLSPNRHHVVPEHLQAYCCTDHRRRCSCRNPCRSCSGSREAVTDPWCTRRHDRTAWHDTCSHVFHLAFASQQSWSTGLRGYGQHLIESGSRWRRVIFACSNRLKMHHILHYIYLL